MSTLCKKVRPFSCKSQILCTSCTFFAMTSSILHFLCYHFGPSLSDVKWRAESDATTSASWIGFVAKLFMKKCIFSENSVFSTTKTYFLSPSATSGRIWVRDDLSHGTGQVLRKLHGCSIPSLVAVAIPEVEKGPKKTPILAKIPLFFDIFENKSMFEIFFDIWRRWIRCIFWRSFTSAIVSRATMSTFLSGSVFMPKNRLFLWFCTEMIARLTTVKSKRMQIIGIDRIRNHRHTGYLKVVSYVAVPFELTKSCGKKFTPENNDQFTYLHWSSWKSSNTRLFAKNFGISLKQRLILVL